MTSRHLAWYRGDCHVHSTLSDGQLGPGEVIAEAHRTGVDFIATTDHNVAVDERIWAEAVGDLDLLVILGAEVTTESGHWLALGVEAQQRVEWRYEPREMDLARAIAQVHDVGGLCIAAHPHAPYATGTFEYPLQGFDGVEVWNGLWASDRPWNADNEAALADWSNALIQDIGSRAWRPSVGFSDAHLPGQLSTPHTVVAAEARTPSALLAGLRAGRSWIAESISIDLSLTVAAGASIAGIGEHLSAGRETAQVRASVRGVPGGTVSLHTEHGVVAHAALVADGPTNLTWSTRTGESAFVRAEVRHSDGRMAALTNPITLS